ncbi:hypothetical protein KCU77_g11029, partial [Aureobasidium melanogenum]
MSAHEQIVDAQMVDAPTQDDTTYAYNFYAVGYDHQVPEEYTQGIWLITNEKKNVKLPEKYKPEDVPPIKPTDVELLEPSTSDVPRGLWVGMRPLENLKHIKAAVNEETDFGTRLKDTAIAEAEDYVLLPKCDKALRVVVYPGEKANYYVLMEQTDGLCMPKKATGDEIFFFKFFRDDNLTAVQSRKTTWPAKIRALIETKTGKKPAKEAKKGKTLEIPWQHDLAYKAPMLMAGYAKTRDIAFCDELERLIVERLEFVNLHQEESTWIISQLFDHTRNISENDFDIATSEMALNEIKKLWPKTEKVLTHTRAQHVMLLKMSITLEKFDVPPGHQKSFLVHYLHTLQSCSDQDCLEISVRPPERRYRLEQAMQLVEASSTNVEVENQIPTEEHSMAFISGIRGYLTKTLETAREFEKAKMDKMSPESIGETLQEKQEAVLKSPDPDSVKFYLDMARRHDHQEILIKEKGMQGEIEKLVKLMDAWIVKKN